MNLEYEKYVEEQLKRLNEFDLEKESYQTIFNFLIEKFGSLAAPIGGLKKGTEIYRGRLCENEKPFEKETDISYRVDIENIKSFGRCHIPYESMFYGAVETEHIKQALLTCLMEILPEARKPVYEPIAKHNEYFTVGKWILKKKIPLPHYMFNEGLFEKYPHLAKERKQLEAQIQREHGEKTTGYIKIIEYLTSKLLERNDQGDFAYKITAALTDFILNHGYPGLLYNSVQTDHEGINVVLHPKAVDQFLELESVTQYVIKFDYNNHDIIPIRKAVDFGENNSAFKWIETGI